MLKILIVYYLYSERIITWGVALANNLKEVYTMFDNGIDAALVLLPIIGFAIGVVVTKLIEKIAKAIRYTKGVSKGFSSEIATRMNQILETGPLYGVKWCNPLSLVIPEDSFTYSQNEIPHHLSSVFEVLMVETAELEEQGKRDLIKKHKDDPTEAWKEILMHYVWKFLILSNIHDKFIEVGCHNYIEENIHSAMIDARVNALDAMSRYTAADDINQGAFILYSKDEFKSENPTIYQVEPNGDETIFSDQDVIKSNFKGFLDDVKNVYEIETPEEGDLYTVTVEENVWFRTIFHEGRWVGVFCPEAVKDSVERWESKTNK